MGDTSGEKVIGDQECFEIVRKKLLEDSIDDFQLIEYQVVPVGSECGYMGEYFMLTATVASSKAPTETRTCSFFMKTPPCISTPADTFNQAMGSFKKEVYIYKTMFPRILDGLEKKSIPDCFMAVEDGVIVLANMTEYDYEMANKCVPFDFEHCLVIMKTLARFHAKSLIFEELNKKNVYEEFSNCLQESLWPLRKGKGEDMFLSAVKGTVTMIDLIDKLDYQEKKKLKEKLKFLSADHRENLLPSTKFKNVVCHGDLWANNILLRYDENRKPQACSLVDFQLARYNPPAHDVRCLLQFTTTRDFRKNYQQQLFKIYWETFATSLKDAGLEASLVFPWKEFIDSIKEFRFISMVHGILNLSMMLVDPSKAERYLRNEAGCLDYALFVDRSNIMCDLYSRCPQYKERMVDALLELHESS